MASDKVQEEMSILPFNVVRCLGIGHYAVVYEAVSNQKWDKGSVYAMKRMNIRNIKALRCALRECLILKRIALEDGRHSPIFVISKGSGFDLSDLLTDSRNHLPEHDAAFYAAEIICGLEWLHQRNIVHLDIKPRNILLSEMGHVVITDFDHAYELDNESGPPQSSDFAGTRGYMAPEICSKIEITVKADIWSLGATIAFLVSGPIYPTLETSNYARLSRQGQWTLENLSELSQPLRIFFYCCFVTTPRSRPDTVKIKKLQFFKHVDWKKVAALEMQPPYLPSQLKRSIKRFLPNFDSHNEEILKCAYSKQSVEVLRGPNGALVVEECRPNLLKSQSAAIMDANLKEMSEDFDFINPSIYKRSKY